MPRNMKVEIENTRIPIIQLSGNKEESPIPLPTGISVNINSTQAIKHSTEVPFLVLWYDKYLVISLNLFPL